MNYINFRLIIVLMVVTVICGGLLSFVYEISYSQIEDNKKKELESSIKNILPQMSTCKNLSNIEGVYRAFDDKNNLLGYVFIGEGQGYQDKIVLVGALSKDLKEILGIEIIESKETPGLGGRITEPFFKDQFKNIRTDYPLVCVKSERKTGNQIQAITGATISSLSVVNIVNKKIEEIKRGLKDE